MGEKNLNKQPFIVTEIENRHLICYRTFFSFGCDRPIPWNRVSMKDSKI